jgi:hypothetical protein
MNNLRMSNTIQMTLQLNQTSAHIIANTTREPGITFPAVLSLLVDPVLQILEKILLTEK